MKLKGIIKIINDDVSICIDGKEYSSELPDDMLDLKIKSIDVKTDKPKDS